METSVRTVVSRVISLSCSASGASMEWPGVMNNVKGGQIYYCFGNGVFQSREYGGKK